MADSRINVKKMRFRHELTANDSSKIALPTSTSPKLNVNVLLSNVTFLYFFAVLDVSFAVNSCLNRSSLHLYLRFYYISVAVTWYRVRGTDYVIPTIFEVLL